MVNLKALQLSGNPLGIAPDITRMPQLHTLDLRETGISQWPVGAATHDELSSLNLRDNLITDIPEAVFTHPGAFLRNRNIELRGNPLSDQTRQRIARYNAQMGNSMQGAAADLVAVAPDVTPWLDALDRVQWGTATELWQALASHEGARSDDVFSVLADLTQSLDYRQGGQIKKNLSLRVWRLLNALGDSTELRETVFLNTYAAGTCGDGAILTFSNMELMYRTHQTLARHDKDRIDRELLGLARQVYFLEHLDRLAENHIGRLNQAYADTPRYTPPDPAEIILFYRVRLREEFNLPIATEQMLYTVETYGVREADITAARQTLRALDTPSLLLESYKTRDFWLRYLERRFPEPFMTIKNVTRYQKEQLNREVPDKHSDEYLDRLQALIDLETAERQRLIRQLTEAAVHAMRRP